MAVAAYKTFSLWGVIFTFGLYRCGNTDRYLSITSIKEQQHLSIVSMNSYRQLLDFDFIKKVNVKTVRKKYTMNVIPTY